MAKILQLITWKKKFLKGVGKVFSSVDNNVIDTKDILDIHRYLIRKTWYKIMLGFIQKMFIELLMPSVVNASNDTNYVSLNNQQCMIQPTLINVHPNEYTQGLHYFSLAFNLDRCLGSCNTLNDLTNKVCVLNKTRFKFEQDK